MKAHVTKWPIGAGKPRSGGMCLARKRNKEEERNRTCCYLGHSLVAYGSSKQHRTNIYLSEMARYERDLAIALSIVNAPHLVYRSMLARNLPRIPHTSFLPLLHHLVLNWHLLTSQLNTRTKPCHASTHNFSNTSPQHKVVLEHVVPLNQYSFVKIWCVS
jgi:hypothetical protein